MLRGDGAKAEASLNKAVELAPEREGALMSLGIFYYEAGQIERAKEVLERYHEMFPQGMNVEQMRATLEAADSQPRNAALTPEGRREFYELSLKLADDAH